MTLNRKSRWQNILDRLNTKRIAVGETSISIDFTGLIKYSHLTTLRDGIEDILSYWGIDRSEAFTRAGYSYTYWKSIWYHGQVIIESNTKELEDILDLLNVVKVHCHNPEGVEINRILGALDYTNYPYQSIPYQRTAHTSAYIETGNNIYGYTNKGLCTEDSDYTLITVLSDEKVIVYFNNMSRIFSSFIDAQNLYATFTRIETFNMVSYLNSVSSFSKTYNDSWIFSPDEGVDMLMADEPALNNLKYIYIHNTLHASESNIEDLDINVNISVAMSISALSFSQIGSGTLGISGNGSLFGKVDVNLSPPYYITGINPTNINIQNQSFGNWYCGFKSRTAGYPALLLEDKTYGILEHIILPGNFDDTTPRMWKVAGNRNFESIISYDSTLGANGFELYENYPNFNYSINGQIEDFFMSSVPYNITDVPIG